MATSGDLNLAIDRSFGSPVNCISLLVTIICCPSFAPTPPICVGSA